LSRGVIVGIVVLFSLALLRAVRPRANTRRMRDDVTIALGALGVLTAEPYSCRAWGIHRPVFRDFRPNAER
jgi:hypothetical protein